MPRRLRHAVTNNETAILAKKKAFSVMAQNALSLLTACRKNRCTTVTGTRRGGGAGGTPAPHPLQNVNNSY